MHERLEIFSGFSTSCIWHIQNVSKQSIEFRAIDWVQGRLRRQSLGPVPDTVFQKSLNTVWKDDERTVERFPIDDILSFTF